MDDKARRLFDLSGSVAVVTGGGSGLGQGMALALAHGGADVAVVGRRLDKLEETARQVRQLGRRALAVAADVTREEDVERMADTVERELGPIGILLNAAGVTVIKPTTQLSLQEWQKVVDTNLTGTFLCTKVVGARMLQRRRGKIINIASLTSRIGFPQRAVYGATKGGVSLFTQSVAVEWAEWGVQVNAIATGFFRTPLNHHLFEMPRWAQALRERIPMGRPGTVDDLAGMVIFLASAASDYVTGQTFFVDGGYEAGEPWVGKAMD